MVTVYHIPVSYTHLDRTVLLRTPSLSATRFRGRLLSRAGRVRFVLRPDRETAVTGVLSLPCLLYTSYLKMILNEYYKADDKRSAK